MVSEMALMGELRGGAAKLRLSEIRRPELLPEIQDKCPNYDLRLLENPSLAQG
jgi:hypothetical protein